MEHKTTFAQEEQFEFALMIEVVDNGGFSEHQDITPTTYAEAAKHPNWTRATEDEYNSLIENGTWSLTTLPPERKAIGSKWVTNSNKIQMEPLPSIKQD